MMTTARSSRHETAQSSAAHTHSPRDGQAQPHRPRAQPLTERKSGHRCALMIRSWSDHLSVASGWASTFPLKTWSHRATTTENGQPTPSRHHVVLSRTANKGYPQLRGVKERHRETPCRPPKMPFGRSGASDFNIAPQSGISVSCSRWHSVPTVDPASSC